MTAPTKASLQRELRAERKESARLREFLSRSQDAHDITRRELSRSIDEHRNNWLREVAGLQIERDRLDELVSAFKAALRPIVAYMETQWPGDIGPELRRLKELCK